MAQNFGNFFIAEIYDSQRLDLTILPEQLGLRNVAFNDAANGEFLWNSDNRKFAQKISVVISASKRFLSSQKCSILISKLAANNEKFAFYLTGFS